MQRSWQRHVLTLLAATALAGSGAVALSSTAAQAADADIKINEVESNGGTPGDWIEITNTGTATVDISGFGVLDNDSTHTKVTAPSGTTLAPGGFYVFDTEVSFGLGSADSARLYAANGTTLLDSYSWTSHATGTYARCDAGSTTFGFVDTLSTRGAANACTPVINEVESSGGTPGDWIELANPTKSAYDASGLVLKDNNASPSLTLPAGTTVPASGFLAVDVESAFGLGSADSARLYAKDTTTLLDSYSWTAHAAVTYGRCPDVTGQFTTTAASTKGAANSCATSGAITTVPWPGGSTVTTVDPANTFSSNLSGLMYQPSGTSAPGTLWGVRNGGPEALYKMTKTGPTWAPSAGEWANGKQLRYSDGTGNPDSEGVTFTDAGPDAGIFVSTERNNTPGTVSRPAILRFDPTKAGTELSATNDWNLTADLPAVGPNLGLEGIAWVPDSYLVAKGLKTSTGATYNPANYANHGTGLFLVGVEANGMVYAYALDLTSNSFTRVTSFASGFSAVMDLNWEPETQKLWVACDDTCQGQTARFDVNSAGAFAPVAYYDRPTGMPNTNNEGFATTPQAECVNGVKPVFWADDNNLDGHSLREGTLSCTALPVTTPTTPTTPTGPTAPAPAADTSAPVVKVKGVKAHKTYAKKRKPTCVATDTGTGVASCTLTQKKKGKAKRGVQKYVVTVTAVDRAGNATTSKTTYQVAKRARHHHRHHSTK